MPSKKAENRPFTDDISIKELNKALDKVLKRKVVLNRGDGSKFYVPVFFRTRDSKLVPDTTPFGMIEVAFTGIADASAVYWNQCSVAQPIACDKNGNPTKYAVRSEGPQPVEFTYTITARAQHWDDMADLQLKIDKIFPPKGRHLRVRDQNLNLFRRGYTAGDNEDFGIFIRTWILGIIGYIYTDNCSDVETQYAVTGIDLEVQNSSDPEEVNSDQVSEDFEIC